MLDTIAFQRAATICGAAFIAVVFAAILSSSVAFALSYGRCAAPAVVASVPHVSDGTGHFDAVIAGEPMGDCYAHHGDVVAVRVPQEQAPKQLERGRPVALAGSCGSDALAGSECGSWSLDTGDRRVPGLTDHMSAQQVEQYRNRPRNAEESVEMTAEEIEQFIYRSRAIRDRRCSVRVTISAGK